ncbi:autotransporter outer membrane beta-barrel domain-containing protein [Citrobacter amalonaticus]|uniref:autotransporter outer membrane beta-barrel domain-containing protein n=1 Tax=Citrobacter amalonaticus TaxID=35703 RepID=UPI00164F26DC|nr:autotransporter outer membrane beta-barrel domain-containing protein [Citrobacter amalonaticus]MBC6536090.1 autotransporter outer membrane beta-barrel domain-containing protein [Citrobacter amalonaticus]HEF0022154.1 autotransporter outer membrane beta-barrel domain-containing protein [Citrobacter amalonaticus]
MLKKYVILLGMLPYHGYAAEAVCSSSDGITAVCNGDTGLVNDIDSKINAYDNITINTTANDRGYGLDFRQPTHHLAADNITISTLGKYSDGIIGRISTAIIDSNLTIKTYGENSSGILLQEVDYANITLTGTTNIYARYGMGIALELTLGSNKNNVLTAGDNVSVVTDGTGSNVYRGAGYGVYAGSAYYQNAFGFIPDHSTARITLGNNVSVQTNGDEAHAVYANKTGMIQVGDISVVTRGDRAAGLKAEDGNKYVPPGTRMLRAQTQSYEGGKIFLTRNVNIDLEGTGSYAMHSTGFGSYIGSSYLGGQQSRGTYIVNGNLLAENKGVIDLRMTQGSAFTGSANSTQLNADKSLNTADNGYIYLDMSRTNSIWNMTEDSVVTRLDLHDANLTYTAPTTFASYTPKFLHVVEDYSGTNGILTLNTVLGGDDSLTDKLYVLGDVAAGNTQVSINNIGGKGALTHQGIEIVNVGGESIGTFTKYGRIVAGAYDYDVVRKGENWYLVSNTATNPAPDPTPTPDPTPVLRPEGGEYVANIAAANTLFQHRLHDRLGEPHYVNALKGETDNVSSLWMRHVGGHTRFKDNSGQINTQANRYVVQLGGDIAQWSGDEKDRYHLGVMGGYANQKSNSHNKLNRYYSNGSIDGYSVGVYGTWLQDNEEKTGAYVDSWLLYNWFDNTVSGYGLAQEDYKSKGYTASLESGYTWKIGEKNERESYYFQTVGQLTWMGVKAKTHREANGTRVTSEGDGNIQSRLGTRVFIKGHSKIDEGKERIFEPFVEANWIHNTKRFGASMSGVDVEQAGTRNIAELKAGVESQLNRNVNLWGNVAQQIGNAGYSDTSAMLGFKVIF